MSGPEQQADRTRREGLRVWTGRSLVDRSTSSPGFVATCVHQRREASQANSRPQETLSSFHSSRRFLSHGASAQEEPPPSIIGSLSGGLTAARTLPCRDTRISGRVAGWHHGSSPQHPPCRTHQPAERGVDDEERAVVLPNYAPQHSSPAAHQKYSPAAVCRRRVVVGGWSQATAKSSIPDDSAARSMHLLSPPPGSTVRSTLS